MFRRHHHIRHSRQQTDARVTSSFHPNNYRPMEELYSSPESMLPVKGNFLPKDFKPMSPLFPEAPPERERSGRRLFTIYLHYPAGYHIVKETKAVYPA